MYRFLILPAALFLAAAGCSDTPTGSNTDDGQTEPWARYAEVSKQSMEADKALIAAELKSAGRTTATRAPYTEADFRITSAMNNAWFASAAAGTMADNIVSFQTPTGGWSKHVDYTKGPRQPGESFVSESDSWTYVGTIDNGATTTELQFLARAYQAQREDRWRAAFMKGPEYLLQAQYPNGCWPQVYPLIGGYQDAVTFNDDAMTRVLALLRDIGRGGIYSFVPADVAQRAAASLSRGIECVVESQVVVGGVRTAWGQQHDPRTLAPVRGRSYELPALSGQESARIVDFLMSLPSPNPAVVRAVHAAAGWFRTVAIHGYTYGSDFVLREQPGAGPIWARLYEIGTNRPIFANRDGVKLYDWNQLTDRRTGYAWFGTAPAATLRQYDSWAVTNP